MNAQSRPTFNRNADETVSSSSAHSPALDQAPLPGTAPASGPRAEVDEAPFVIPGQSGRPLPDWRIMFGLTVTIGWLIMLSLYVDRAIGWAQMPDAPIEQLGNFLEGAFAPLAFL